MFFITGWKVVGGLPKKEKKYVLIVAPHTSYWDFPVGVGARSIIRLKSRFLIKAELFKNPVLAWVFRLMGGIPVDRGNKNNNIVDIVKAEFDKHEEFCVTITPEGTRSKVHKWKTGFHRIARAAGVPIVMVSFDFKKKTVELLEPFYPTDDLEADMNYILNYYRGITAKHPELGVT